MSVRDCWLVGAEAAVPVQTLQMRLELKMRMRSLCSIASLARTAIEAWAGGDARVPKRLGVASAGSGLASKVMAAGPSSSNTGLTGTRIGS